MTSQKQIPADKSASKEREKADFGKVGYDDLLEDIFGISIRGLKSLKALFVAPADFFEAARRPDWGGKYTPSLRLWLALMTLLIALQFIWAADTSLLISRYSDIPKMLVELNLTREGANIEALQNYDILKATKEINARNLLVYPFIFVATFLLFAAIFRPWKQGENFIVSQRYVFGVIVAGSVFGLIMTISSYFVPATHYSIFEWTQLGGVFLIYIVTAYRGPMRNFRKDRAGMSLVMAMMMMVTLTLAQIISMLFAMGPTFAEISAL